VSLVNEAPDIANKQILAALKNYNLRNPVPDF
jgi:hypothetical protein